MRPRSALPEFDGKDYDEILSEVMSRSAPCAACWKPSWPNFLGWQKRDPLKGIVLKKCWRPVSRPACRA
jgi:flagellar biosynthesis protein FlhF